MPLKCPNGCALQEDTIAHRCMKHANANIKGKPFNCKIKNCKLAALKKEAIQ